MEEDILTLQIDGPRRRVYIKFNSELRLQTILHDTNGQLVFHHDNGELSKVTIELADVCNKKVRLVRLPPEVTEDIIKKCLSKYGEVKNIRDEMWTQAYRYIVYNGVRIVEIKIKQHLPSHLLIAGHDTLISYDGQPPPLVTVVMRSVINSKNARGGEQQGHLHKIHRHPLGLT